MVFISAVPIIVSPVVLFVIPSLSLPVVPVPNVSSAASSLVIIGGAGKTVNFNVLCYPYDAATYSANQATIEAWVTAMRDDEGVKIQAVMADYVADNEAIINVVQTVVGADKVALAETQYHVHRRAEIEIVENLDIILAGKS